MRPGDKSPKATTGKKTRHEHERWQDPHGAQAPRSWNNKTMHHPATRIGEIKHGKS